jgi:hypothetical protein
MLNNKRRKAVLVAIVIFSMVAVYGFMPTVKAASLQSLKDTLSVSTPGEIATHTIDFHMGADLTAGQYVKVTFEVGKFDTSNMAVSCPGDAPTQATTTDEVTCTVTTSMASSSQIIVTGVGNPSLEGDYDVFVTTYTALDAEIESSGAKVYIINAVTVSATVPATLTFGISAVNAADTINGIAVTATSSTTTLPFGDLNPGSVSTVGHQLSVATNAANGYVVTVEQDGELRNAAGATINSFNNSVDGSGSTTPQAWDNPHGTLDQDHTYGHMGISSDDDDYFGAQEYIGLNGATSHSIMKHTGPADGTTPGIGMTKVAYSVEISALQEAGEYSAVITYICTPTY